MFRLKDLRNDENFYIDEKSLKNFIINNTNSVFEDLKVKKERTGKRPSPFSDFKDEIKADYIFEKVFLITALKRVNPDKNSRYMLLSENYNPKLINVLNDYVSAYFIRNKSEDDLYLSKFFRNNLGRAFSFIDIDFIFQKGNNILIVEEKSRIESTFGYGQLLSYKEFLEDVLKQDLNISFCLLNIEEDVIKCHKYIDDEFKEINIRDKDSLVSFFNGELQEKTRERDFYR